MLGVSLLLSLSDGLGELVGEVFEVSWLFAVGKIDICYIFTNVEKVHLAEITFADVLYAPEEETQGIDQE